MISRKIKVKGSSCTMFLSWRLKLITLTETLMILDITKTKSLFYFSYIEPNKWKSCFCFFTDSKQHKACELEISLEIMHHSHTCTLYLTWLALTLKVIDMIQGFWYFARSRSRESKSAKSREIHKNTQNPVRLARNLTKCCTCRHNIFESYLGCWGCLLAVNLLIYLQLKLRHHSEKTTSQNSNQAFLD